ncbi:HNH endonuclease [Nocardioides sp. NPDC057577]|uniref:HNH endonuclease n=1 Tax=Nocardioides sp. NPDC057577 TaxID=3346171 RepID=UPI00367221A7
MHEKYKTDGPQTLDGVNWWHVTVTPGTKKGKFGGEKRLSAYLNFNVEVGESFTMRDLRGAIGGDGIADTAEHLNRRLRELRPDDWVISSYKDDRGLPPDVYRLDAIGTRVWLGERNKRDKPSAKVRRLVFERDLSTCQVCGVARGEEYIEYPGRIARVTLGHLVPGERLGGASVDELQTECAMCNEALRDLIPNPELYEEVLPSVRSMTRKQLVELLKWIQAGKRGRTPAELAYGRIRRLGSADREKMAQKIFDMIGERV